MKNNSQYVNQINVSINELCRLQFNEVVTNGEVVPVAFLSMFPEAAELFAKTILESVDKHKLNIQQQKNSLNTDKELN